MAIEPGVEPSTIGNLVDLKEGQVASSRFIIKRDTGVYVDLARIESVADFSGFVSRVFSAGALFRALDYPSFVALLYDEKMIATPAGSREVRFAAEIITFPPARQALYRALKIEAGEAIYMFEPAFLDSLIEAPIFGELPDGSTGIVCTEQKTISSRTPLDIDEFIAAAWEKGVRFGIDVGAVCDAIKREKTERVVIARPLPFTPGHDAEIKEQTSDLRRDNTPRRLFGGKIDLCQFQNRYPQVVAEVRLLKKTPRILGVDGRDIAGQPLLAPLPNDLDLISLSGSGTRVVREDDGEYLLAAVNGFLNIDTATNQLSITDKIVSREGVSARTTGDLSLAGDDYEEYGEIQEKRSVECRSITAHADVFGSILSHGGTICLKKSLVGGSASNENGDIVVEGFASGATLVALQGCVTVNRAESCLIIARKIVLGQGARCDLVADEVRVEHAEGCALAGKVLHVVSADARGQSDCVLSILIPDPSGYQARRDALSEKRAALALEVESQHAKAAGLRGQKEVASYLAVAGKLQRKELVLNAGQQAPWQKLVAQVAPVLRVLAQLSGSIKALDEQSAVLAGQAEALRVAEQAACLGIACTVESVIGETRIRTLAIKVDAPALAALPPKEIKVRLRSTDGATSNLFADSSGEFSWHYTPPVS